MEQQYGICRVSIAPIRTADADKAEMSSQLLFGEVVEILEKSDRWLYVRHAYDGYEGWMDFKQLFPLTAEQFATYRDSKYLAPAAPLNVVTDALGTKYYLSPGSSLPGFNDGHCMLGDEKFEVLFQPLQVPEKVVSEDLIATALFFRNTPYLWGARNFFGIDCSGFVQTVFKLHGVPLRRDAWQQGEQGTTVDFLPEIKAGDVAFFDNAEGRIIHVGLMLNANEIIHSSGRVRIDKMDNEGIYSADLGRYTHKLRIVKRFF